MRRCPCAPSIPADSVVLAGGQSLMPLLNLRLARPEVLIDLGNVPGLDRISELDGGVSRRRDDPPAQRRAIRPDPDARARWWQQALAYVGHPTIRNRGTVGGSLAHADRRRRAPGRLRRA